MASRGNTKLSGFYFPWPLRNVQLARQIDQSRENTYKLAPLTRAAYVDPQPVSANAPGEHDLSGWAVGMRDFRNKFRIYYDQQFHRFSIQHNVGTEAVETWDDMILIRESDGRVTVVQDGGLEAQGGFYNQVPRNLATSGRFDPPSFEWVFTHNLNTKPILWDTFNLEDKSIVPVSVDVSNPNIAYFYFSQAYSGFAVVTGEQSRFQGIHVDDGNGNVFPTATRLGFNGEDFYASTDGHGMPVINLQPFDISDIDPDTIPVNLIVTDTVASQSFDLSTIADPKIVFNRNDFYFGADVAGNPIINIRGGAGGGSTGNTAAAGSFSTSTEWALNHGLNNSDLNWSVYDDQGMAIIPSKVSIHDPNTAYFYFGTNLMSGRAVVTAAGGATSFDTTPFIRKDGSVPFIGNESMGGFKLTNVGTPTATGDAANKAYVDSKFYLAGVVVSDTVDTFPTNKITFAAGGFYLDRDSQGQAVVNLKVDSMTEFLPVFIEAPLAQTNLAIDPYAPYPYTISQANYDVKSGSCVLGFYISRLAARNKNGISVTGMDPLTASTTLSATSPSGANIVNKGDVVYMSVISNTVSKHLRLVLTIQRF